MENFFKRLETYTTVSPTDAITDIIVKIMIEVLNVLAIATKEMKQSRASALVALRDIWLFVNPFSEKYVKKLVGRNDIEDALKRLDRLTQEEARMAAVQILKLTHIVISGTL